MRLEPIWPGASFGMRIFDFDSSAPLSALVHRHKIVAVDGQHLTEKQYIALAGGLGRLVPFKLKNYSAAARPEIMILDNQAQRTGIGGRKIGNMWHSDSSYLERPLDLTLLLAKTVPAAKFGGNTLFVDTHAILSQLEPEVIAELAQCQARHEVLWTYKVTNDDVGQSLKELVDALRARNGFAVHPCLSTHPHTGVRNVNLNPGYTTGIENMDFDRSNALLERVFESALRPSNIFSYEWKTDDLLIWDNRSVWHMATAVESSVERVMHRIGVEEVP